MPLSDYQLGNDYWEDEDSGEAEFNSETNEATRIFIVKGEGLTGNKTYVDFLKALHGWTDSNNPGNGNGVVRHLPAQHPTFTWLWCQDVKIKPIKGTYLFGQQQAGTGPPTARPSVDGNGFIKYDLYRMTAVYRALDWEPTLGKPNTYLSQYVDFASEFLTIPQFNLKWVTAPQTNISESPGKLFPSLEYKCIFRQLPLDVIPLASIRDTLGKLNDAKVALGMWGTAANPKLDVGTMLFTGAEKHPVWFPGGDHMLWDVQYTFHIRSKDHNMFYRPSSNQFEFVDGGSSPTNPPTHPVYSYAPFADNLWSYFTPTN